MLDPAVQTSVAHTWFLAGEYGCAIETYGGRAAYYLDVAAWAALGHEKRAIALLTERLAKESLSGLMNALMGSLLALLQGRTDQAFESWIGLTSRATPRSWSISPGIMPAASTRKRQSKLYSGQRRPASFARQ